ncbi:Protein of unknown function [Gryllus bimaculatus]|nr:Protein of unknown function [Gryllus bimaculatus]
MARSTRGLSISSTSLTPMLSGYSCAVFSLRALRVSQATGKLECGRSCLYGGRAHRKKERKKEEKRKSKRLRGCYVVLWPKAVDTDLKIRQVVAERTHPLVSTRLARSGGKRHRIVRHLLPELRAEHPLVRKRGSGRADLLACCLRLRRQALASQEWHGDFYRKMS